MVEDDLHTVPWTQVARVFGLWTGLIQIVSNGIGAGICTSYFLFFDQSASTEEMKTVVRFTVVMFIGLIALGTGLQIRWQRDIPRFIGLKVKGEIPSPSLTSVVQRKILNFPFVASVTALINWGLASVIMPTYIYLDLAKTFEMAGDDFSWIRTCIGILISGFITSFSIFFSIEAICRRIWPFFFPEGNLINTRGALRLRLQYRLLLTFAMVSLVPMILMSVLSYNKARMMLVVDPETVIQGLFSMNLFLLGAGLGLSILLAILVSATITGPVGQMEQAMERVEKGDLKASVVVSANDELGGLAHSFDTMIDGLRDRERIRDTFGRFVTPQIASAILEHPPVPGGENTEVSVLFSDIRNYTSICETMTPDRVIGLLNGYFTYMVEAIEKHHGLVYQFVGDGIMAVFGAPVKLADHASCAVHSALDMMEALDRFNREKRSGHPPIRIGIGINSGSVVAGIIGTEQRMEYRVVGDTVNLAARIESLNKEFGTEILISKGTANGLEGSFRLKAFDPIRVKGKSQPVEVFEVIHPQVPGEAGK